MKEFIEEHKSILAVQSFLKWCYNFKQKDIDILCNQSDEFKRAWYEYILPSAEGKMCVDYLVIVDTLFGKVSFKTMQLVIDLAMERYANEEANRLEFSFDIERKREEMIAARK